MRIALPRQIHKSSLILAYCKFGLKEEHMCAMYCDTDHGFIYRAMNSVYVFAEDIMSSVTRHFAIPDLHHAVINRLGIYDDLQQPTTKSLAWCIEAGAVCA